MSLVKIMGGCVGAAAGCDLLIFDIAEKQGQKIAACGSSYRGRVFFQLVFLSQSFSKRQVLNSDSSAAAPPTRLATLSSKSA